MRTTETERRAYVEAFHRSGLRLIDFCRERGLNPKTFYAWRKRYPSHDFIKGDFRDEARIRVILRHKELKTA